MKIRKKEITDAFRMGLIFTLLVLILTYLLPAKYESKVVFLVSSQEVKQLTLASSQTPQTVLANFLKNSWLLRNIAQKSGVSFEELQNEYIVSTVIPSGTVELKNENTNSEKSIIVLKHFVNETRKLQAEIINRKSIQQYEFLRKSIEKAKEDTLYAEKQLVSKVADTFVGMDASKINEMELLKRNSELELTALNARKRFLQNKAESVVSNQVMNEVMKELVDRESMYDTLRKTEGEFSPDLLSSKLRLNSFEMSIRKFQNKLVDSYKSGSTQEYLLIASQEEDLKVKIDKYTKWLKEAKSHLSAFTKKALEYNAEKEKYLALEKEYALTGVTIQRSLGDWTIFGEPMTMEKPTNKKYLLYGLISFTVGILLSLIWRQQPLRSWLKVFDE